MLTPLSSRARALGVVVVLALLLSGCGSLLDGPVDRYPESLGPTPSKSPTTPREKLAASVPTYRTPAFSWSMVNEGARWDWTDSAGVVNPAGKSYRLTNVVRDPEYGLVTNWHILVVHPRTWVKIVVDNPRQVDGVPEFPGKWGLVDQDRVTDKSIALTWDLWSNDPAYVEDLFRAVVDVTETHPGVFEGTIDVTAAPAAEAVDTKIVTALGPKAKAVPFHARLDPQGRFRDLVLTVPATAKTKAVVHRIAYRDYGRTPAAVPPTAAETAPITEDVYELINS
ncbi:hypothetical protein [Cryptosporangium japonicum]|uniref:Lipoprotein n=1 Tax=Cryptosporangium japonicum TaxID=80872 RepID=A0ABN0UK93_9ACTN